VIVIDNTSFHRTKKVQQLFYTAGFKLICLPFYSSDLNPIEDFFVELKALLRKTRQPSRNSSKQCFNVFLEWGINAAGSRKRSVYGHFRYAGITVEEL
jgi:transposase